MSLLVILMAGSASFNKEQPQANVPTIKEPDSFITIQGTTLKASVPPYFIASFAILGDLTSELEEYYLYDLLTPYDWDADKMYEVMICESGGNPNTHNFSHETKDDSWGLFQINRYGDLAKTRPSAEWLLEPENNVKYAYKIWQAQGKIAWSNCW